jgi:hypothetical protein
MYFFGGEFFLQKNRLFASIKATLKYAFNPDAGHCLSVGILIQKNGEWKVQSANPQN